MQGRFTSCDPVNLTKRHIVNPQRWNLYVYVNNNPLALVDPDGRDPQGKGGGRVIDVFLAYEGSNKDVARVRSQIREQTRGSNARIRVYGEDGSNANNVNWSLKSGERRTTIVVAHSDYGSAVEIGGRNADGAPRLGATRVGLVQGEITAQGVLTYDANGTPYEVRSQIKAENFFLFSCRISPDTAQSIANRMESGGSLIINDGGDDGNCAQGVAINMAVISAVDIANGGTAESAAQNLQAENQRAVGGNNMPANSQQGDTIVIYHPEKKLQE